MSNLYIDRKGIEIKLSNDTLICYENNERVSTIPIAPIDRLYLKGDVKISAALLAKLGEQNIGVIFLSGRKNEPTMFLPNPHNDASRRFAQYQMATNEDFCLAFAQKLMTLKMVLQKNWLWQASNARPEKRFQLEQKAKELDELIKQISEQHSLPSLRGIEGRAASVYFTALSLYLPPALRFSGRNRRPPRDPFNALLSLTYTLLHCEAVLASYGAGLDPYIGFYHALDFGRESLACDLIEPLRPLVDNWLIGCFRQEIFRAEYFTTTENGCVLGKTGRVQFYKEYEQQIHNWRKMLTENCFDLVKVLDKCDISLSPQRRENMPLQAKIAEQQSWQELLNHYYFNQRCMADNIEFSF